MDKVFRAEPQLAEEGASSILLPETNRVYAVNAVGLLSKQTKCIQYVARHEEHQEPKLRLDLQSLHVSGRLKHVAFYRKIECVILCELFFYDINQLITA